MERSLPAFPALFATLAGTLLAAAPAFCQIDHGGAAEEAWRYACPYADGEYNHCPYGVCGDGWFDHEMYDEGCGELAAADVHEAAATEVVDYASLKSGHDPVYDEAVYGDHELAPGDDADAYGAAQPWDDYDYEYDADAWPEVAADEASCEDAATANEKAAVKVAVEPHETCNDFTPADDEDCGYDEDYGYEYDYEDDDYEEYNYWEADAGVGSDVDADNVDVAGDEAAEPKVADEYDYEAEYEQYWYDEAAAPVEEPSADAIDEPSWQDEYEFYEYDYEHYDYDGYEDDEYRYESNDDAESSEGLISTTEQDVEAEFSAGGSIDVLGCTAEVGRHCRNCLLHTFADALGGLGQMLQNASAEVACLAEESAAATR